MTSHIVLKKNQKNIHDISFLVSPPTRPDRAAMSTTTATAKEKHFATPATQRVSETVAIGSRD